MADRDSAPDSERDSGHALAGADDPLVVGALATFHAAALVAALVGGLYLAGPPLGELLDGLRTSVGLGLYLALWATTWWTNRRWLDAVADPDGSAWRVVGIGGKWGGVNGALFFWVLFGVAVVPFVGLELDAALAFATVFGVGTLLALGAGAIVGVAAAALDVALFGVAARLGPESSAAREASSEAR